MLRELEAPLIAATLALTRGNQIKAAEMLGLNRNTLRKKIRDLESRAACAELSLSSCAANFVAIVQHRCIVATLRRWMNRARVAISRRSVQDFDRARPRRRGQRASFEEGRTAGRFGVDRRSARALLLALATFIVFAGFTPIIPTPTVVLAIFVGTALIILSFSC